jgi:ribonuclease D
MDAISLDNIAVFDGDVTIDVATELRDESMKSGLAVDIETTGLSPLGDAIQAVTVGSPRRVAVVPIKDGRMPIRLAAILEDPSVLKIFHHGLFDLSFCKAQWGLEIGPIFCTKVAARIAGTSRNPTLQSLVFRFLGIQLDKSEQRSDWARRPLNPEQVQYAASDVRFLHLLRQELSWALSDAGRLRVFEAAMDFLPVRAQLELMGLGDVFAYELREEQGPWHSGQ